MAHFQIKLARNWRYRWFSYQICWGVNDAAPGWGGDSNFPILTTYVNQILDFCQCCKMCFEVLIGLPRRSHMFVVAKGIGGGDDDEEGVDDDEDDDEDVDDDDGVLVGPEKGRAKRR